MRISAGKGELISNYSGFQRIINLHKQIKTINSGDELIVEMPHWFDANMCAPFGAILSFIKNKNIITLNVTDSVMEILQKNKFFDKVGFITPPKLDNYKSTIEYFQFDVNEDNAFKKYVETHFGNNKHGIPRMSKELLRKFRESLYEIFGNSVLHSETDYIFACGQHFPSQKRLDFSIVDLGIGFHGNINKIMNLDLSPEEAIVWAMEENKTTKRGGVPGGLGLKLIKEFIEKNKGKMQIVTYNGYWEFSNGKTNLKKFVSDFPGTAVNIEINTADSTFYYLESENYENIF
ncbi:MAG: ATP-binding protein [Candidatus Methanoperedens sp.]|nr:ATP-binding protein [Candidatus Methanoperedens sp.]